MLAFIERKNKHYKTKIFFWFVYKIIFDTLLKKNILCQISPSNRHGWSPCDSSRGAPWAQKTEEVA